MNEVSDYRSKWKEFKTKYEAAAKMTNEMCVQAYLCSLENDSQFRTDLMNKYGVNKSAASKMITAGEIITKTDHILPSSYSNVYELAPVKEDIDNFCMFVSDHSEKTIETMTQKEIRAAVNSYIIKDETDNDVEIVDKNVEKQFDPFMESLAAKSFQLMCELEDTYDKKGKVKKDMINIIKDVYNMVSSKL